MLLFLIIGGSENHFQAIVWSLKTKQAKQMLQFSILSQRNKGLRFHNLTFLLMRLRYRL